MILLFLTALLFAPLAALPAADAPQPKPNILIVINDDLSWLECSAYGNSSIPTPQFDRVAKAGVLFTSAYCSAPSCAPARAALLTGRNFWELEQGAFIQAWLPAKFATLPEILEKAGYHAGYTGKGWGPGLKEPTGKRADPAGKQWIKARIKSPPDGISNIDYAANFAQFLDARPAGKPFYFWAGLNEPHGPWGPHNYKKLGVGLDTIKVPGFLPDTPGVRRSRANYLYEVRYADETLGKLLKLLDDRGELTNTLVIVTGDNGTPVPRAKANVYDWGVHVPLAMMWPARAPAGRTVRDFVGFPDLAPTILEAAGLPVPPDISGRSVLETLLSTSSGRVKEIEVRLPKQHPVGMTFQNKGGKNQTLYDSPADWISPNSEGGFRDNPPDLKGAKVVLSDTDHLWGIGGDATWVWKTFLRGLNPIFMDTYDGRVLGKVRPQDDGPRLAMGQALALSRRIDLARCTPQSSLSSTGYCLAQPGVSYVVFAPEGGSFNVDLNATGGLLRVEWLHPGTSGSSAAESVAGGARRNFATPAGQPVVLLLLNPSRD